ncbi:MAG: hemolysin family protein [Proteobacteria bacterium]|nr:hemolysin family protein [Pseudomonadota bacterium]MBU1686462.1 hemolysin family protein [Pseudomonadota bacterium]
MIIQLIIVMTLAIVVSALCSVMEAALYSVPMGQVILLEKKGLASGRILKQLKAEIHKPITAILTLNTIANTMGASVAGALAASIFGSNILGLFSAIFTLLILVFAEIFPKTIGVAYCRELAPIMAYPMMFLVKILHPAIRFCHALTRLIPRRTGVPLVSADEVSAIAALSKQSGEIGSQEEMVITNILDLKNKYVIDVMTPRTVTFTLSDDLTVAQAWENYRDQWNRHSRVPVYHKDSDNIVGIIIRQDVMQTAAGGMDSLHLSALSRPVHFVPESVPLSRVMMDFFEKRRHLFVVVDEYGSVTGVISLEDIIEEIVGQEIMDESDQTRDMRTLAKMERKKRTEGNAVSR